MKDNLIIMESIQGFIEKNKKFTIKFSLGKYSEAFGFDSQIFNIGNHKKIFDLLESCNTWESASEEILEEFIEEYEIVDSLVFACSNSPFDFKLQAIKNTLEKESSGYNKTILRYTRKYHSFILSNDSDYYFDLEIVNNNVDSKYLAESSYLKILDILKIFEDSNFLFKALK